MRFLIRTGLFISLIGLSLSPALAAPQAAESSADETHWDDTKDGPLPHWGDQRRPEPSADRSLHPYAVDLGGDTPPTSGVIESQSEYGPSDGLLFRFSTGAWPTVVTDCVAAITGDPLKDDKAYVVVNNASQQQFATNQFTAAGADMSKVEFAVMPSGSIWLRDYGPAFIIQDGAFALVDSHYYILSRTMDNFVPCLLGEDFFQIPVYHGGYNSSAGGNFLPGPNRSAFVSEMVYTYNPNFTHAYVHELYRDYLGIDTLHVMPDLPVSVDLTGHIDMWMYIIDEDTVIISEFIPGSDPTAIEITENAVTYMQNLGFEVFRVPDHNDIHPSWPSVQTHFTYTNSMRLNDRIFIPTYGEGDPTKLQYDEEALATFQAAAPDCEIIQIPCYEIIWAAGAIHCISMNVPRRLEAEPAAHLISPNGGELLACGATHEICWAACDDDAVTSIDLYYSVDGGATFPHLIASGLDNDSHEDWIVPDLSPACDTAVVKVVATDGDTNSGEDVSETVLEIRDAIRTVYDFSTNGGVDRWGWGSDTLNWAALNGTRYPATVTTPIDVIDRDAFDKLAASDATGGDTDPNRFISLKPAGGSESTHIFDFTIYEDPETILDIGILWEGYSDMCYHTEIYVWDNVRGNWSNGAGTTGNNMYMANYAGNRDDELAGHIRTGFDRYVDGNGLLTVLVYTDVGGQESFHDYIGVTVTSEFTLASDTIAVPEAGGTVNFTLAAGSGNADRNYLLVGGTSGTEPGFPLPGGVATLPVNWDWFSDLEMTLLNTSIFSNFMGTLDAQGEAAAQMNVPPLPPGSAGLMMYYAYCCNDPFDLVSNPITIEVVD
ncbi:MAG: agmatine deiminase family protein [Planctomycetota bacterium]|jgi:agmatine deiminase